MPPVQRSWKAIADSVTLLAAQATGIPAAAEALNLVKALAGAQNEQTLMLERIGASVELIRTGPFHTALEHLDTAARKAAAGEDYAHHLTAAEDSLIAALGQKKSLEEASVIQFNLAIVAAAKGELAEARHRLAQSYDAGRRVAADLGSRADDVQVLRGTGPAGKAGTVALLAAVVLMGKPIKATTAVVKRVGVAKKGREAASALEAYVPFLETVARARNAITPAEPVPSPRLDGDLKHGYLLSWTTTPRS